MARKRVVKPEPEAKPAEAKAHEPKLEKVRVEVAPEGVKPAVEKEASCFLDEFVYTTDEARALCERLYDEFGEKLLPHIEHCRGGYVTLRIAEWAEARLPRGGAPRAGTANANFKDRFVGKKE